jgi:1-acyl-sn-glycerol-3-phosphate acyltransferase
MPDEVTEKSFPEQKTGGEPKKADTKLSALRPEDFPPDSSTRTYAITRVIVQLLMPLLGGITVRGGENIPKRGPILLAPNHRAYMDPPYLSMVTKRQLHLMAKDTLFQTPVFGPYIAALGAFPVKRGAADRGAIRQAIEELKAGHVLGIFPEGTRADSGTLMPAERGFALIAKQTGIPIVPIALEGTDRVHPKHSKRLHRAHVTATIGKPMTAAEMLAANPDPTKDALTIIGEATTRAIAALMTEPVTILESVEKEPEATAEKEKLSGSFLAKKLLPLVLTLVVFGVILFFVARRK